MTTPDPVAYLNARLDEDACPHCFPGWVPKQSRGIGRRSGRALSVSEPI